MQEQREEGEQMGSVDCNVDVAFDLQSNHIYWIQFLVFPIFADRGNR
jgi:hypothetical protein